MGKTPLYIAVFSNGEVLRRQSEGSYTHAYFALCARKGWDNTWRVSGFSTSPTQAAKDMEAGTVFWTRWGATVVFSEIVEVEVR